MSYSLFQEALEYQVDKNGDEVVFTYLENGEDETESITFNELSKRSKIVSGFLQQSYQPDQKVILMLPNDLTFIYALIGSIYAGVISIPLHPINNNATLEKCKHVILDTHTSIILSTRKVFNSVNRKFGDEVKQWTWILIDEIEESYFDAHQKLVFSADKIVFLQYTSGSTNHPKGIKVSHTSLIANLEVICERFTITENDVIVSWLPFYHDMGIIAVLFLSVFSGLKCILFPPLSFLQSPLRWLRIIEKYKGTISGAPNFAYDLCAERIFDRTDEHIDLSSWNQAFCGSEPVKVSTYHNFCNRFKSHGFSSGAFYPAYGMAEATLMISGGERGTPPEIVIVDKDELKKNRLIFSANGVPLISCGTSSPGHSIKIVNREKQDISNGNEIGEIWFSGPSLTSGYWNKDSDDVFSAKINCDAETKYLRTGDLGFLFNNEIYITGRLKEIIIINGLNYYPKDIEEAVERKEYRIKTNCCAAFEFNSGKNTQLAFLAEVDRKYINDIDFEDVTRAIRSIISEDFGLKAEYVGILSTGKIPKTTSGKLQRTLYQKLLDEGQLQTIYEWKTASKDPDTVKEGDAETVAVENFNKWLINRVSDILDVENTSIDALTALNKYGLDSISATGLSGEISKFLNRPISPTIFYNYPNIKAISEFLFPSSLEENSADLAKEKKSDGHHSAEIAVIGMAFNFPGAVNQEELWNMLENKKSVITHTSYQRSQLHNKCNPAGYIADAEFFDAEFFNISDREAIQMDPQHRLLMENSYRALEDANINIDEISGSDSAVFIGAGNGDYYKKYSTDKALLNAYSGLGNSFAIAANRLSYFYNLKGPSMSVDTACSSSLVAVHLGINSLLSKESGLVIAGGVNLIFDDSLDMVFEQAGMLSSDHLCKTFDAAANGYVRGEGCGIVILKRLEDALNDGDRIHAIIKGSAINQDGATNGITAPNGNSQKEVIGEAIRKAGIKPEELTFIETHGTGTPLGDPIEVNALAELFKDRDYPCYLGAVKANIGHLEFAAGIAGLIKTILCLKHKKIPGNRNLISLNPLIKVNDKELILNKDMVEWQSNGMERYAGISSFGFGGTNAHLILKEAPENTLSLPSAASQKYILSLSARTQTALIDLKEQYVSFLKHTDLQLSDICFTSNTTRKKFRYRLAVNSLAKEQLIDLLENKSVNSQSYTEELHKVVFLYTGQGSQYIEMGKDLYTNFSVYKENFDLCSDLASEYLDVSLVDLVFNEVNQEMIHQTKYSQAALFSLEYSLSKLLLSFEIYPDVLIGHSIGEYAAACIAGVFSLADAVKLVCHRGIYMQEVTEKGAMYSVFVKELVIHEYIAAHPLVSIAAYNTPDQLVLSGSQPVVESIIAKLAADGISSSKLNVSHAFHSPLMHSAAEKFLEIAKQVNYSKPKYKIVSSVTGSYANAELTTPEYWCNQILQSVRFSKGIASINGIGRKMFIEIGPQPILNSLVAQHKEERDHIFVSCLKKSDKSVNLMLTALAACYENGININWNALYDNAHKKVAIPQYKFQKQKYWITKKVQHAQSPSGIFDADLLRRHFLDQKNCSADELALLPKLLEAIQDYYQQQNLEEVATKKILYTHNWIEKTKPELEFDNSASPHWIVITDNDPDKESFLRIFEKKVVNISYLNYEDLFQISDTKDAAGLIPPIKEIIAKTIKNITEKPVHILFAVTAIPNRDIAWQLSDLQLRMMISLSAISLFLKENKGQVSAMWMLTRDAISTVHETLPDLPVFSTLWGAAKTLSLEHPVEFGGIINYSGNDDQLFSAISSDLLFEKEEQFINYIKGKRFVYRIQERESYPEKAIISEYYGNYIISGGLGSLGMYTAKWLSDKGASKIILLTRRALIDQETLTKINLLESGNAEILVEQCDIRVEQDVARLYAKLKEANIEVNGLINAAGNIDYLEAEEISLTKIKAIVDTKVLGTWLLFDAFKHEPLDIFINFSSISSAWGASGLMLYAAANHFLDSFAYYLRNLGINGISINWGPWNNSQMVSGSAKSKLEKNGILAIDPVSAIEIMQDVIQSDDINPIIADVKWDKFYDLYALGRKRPVFEYFNSFGEDLSIVESTYDLFTANINSFEQDEERINYLLAILQKKTMEILGHQTKHKPSIHTGFFELGLDSLMALEMKHKLEKLTGVKLPNTLIFEHPNIKSLAGYMLSLVRPAVQEPEQERELKSAEHKLMDKMSEAELADLLLSELNKNS